MTSATALLRWAGGIMIVLGVGHLGLLLVFSGEDVAGWVDRGVWAAVPLQVSASDAPTVESLTNATAFWAGPGSFAVPLALLGCLVWWLAGRAVAVPAWLGWGIVVWTAIGGIVLVPSPFFAGTIAGVLIVVAARRSAATPLTSSA